MQLKVLIVEDHESASISVEKTLNEMNVNSIEYSSYCDDAFTLLKKSIEKSSPFDLMITDLNFEEDHRSQSIKSGFDLIMAIKIMQPFLKTIIFSAENNTSIIKKLWEEKNVDGFVGKSRGDAKELKKAIQKVLQGERYFNQQNIAQARQQNVFTFSDYDILILKQMVEGKRQEEIANYLKENKIQPSALSSIEKRIRLIKNSMNFSTNEQMIAFCVKKGIV